MRNDEVARVFARIADLLELKGESGFRVRSYQRAARAIEHWAVSVEQLAREGGLKTIPGVGDAIAKKTDTCSPSHPRLISRAYLEELRFVPIARAFSPNDLRIAAPASAFNAR